MLRQRIGVRDVATGELYFNGDSLNGFEMVSGPDGFWEPGMWAVAMRGRRFSMKVDQIALYRPQGFVLRVELKNESAERRTLELVSVQQPSIRRPKRWEYGSSFVLNAAAPVASADGGVVVHSNAEGAVAVGLAGASVSSAGSAGLALALPTGSRESPAQGNTASALGTRLVLAPGAGATAYIAIATALTAGEASAAVRQLLEGPASAASAARRQMEETLVRWFEHVPPVTVSEPGVERFYYHAAAQLLYARWKLGKTLLLDPWYSTSGRDSGALNAYAWDFQYAALAFTLLDPAAMRACLVALAAAPLTEHYSIEPIGGTGVGPFYAYNPYAYTSSVDEYLTATRDWGILNERQAGKSVLEWLIALAEWGETDRDPDGNGLLDFGTDRNLLELKKTGDGPGYMNEVPSPNGERVYVYQTVADLMEKAAPELYRDKIRRFREMAVRVQKALNDVLWLEKEGWYGTRQRDGSVVPIYTIQVFDLLRFPGLVPPARARRLVTHLNEGEFVGPWGVRSMSAQDRLFDYNDHDWAGPISYAGDGPQLSADLFTAGFVSQAWMALRKLLWWPDHMAVYPQGIVNDSYLFRVPQSARFGGRVSAGRSNVIAGCAGMETVLRGVFGLELGRDGSIGFSNNRSDQAQPSALAYPFQGRTWTVTEAAAGLDVRTDDGFASTLFLGDGTLRISLESRRILIEAGARTESQGRLAVSSAYLAKALGARSPKQLAFRVNGAEVRPDYSDSEAALIVNTGPDSRARIEITPAGDQTPAR